MRDAFGVQRDDLVSKAGVAVPPSAGQNIARFGRKLMGKQGKHSAVSNKAQQLVLARRRG